MNKYHSRVQNLARLPVSLLVLMRPEGRNEVNRMLSDTIFEGITMIVRDCARMKVNDYGYDDKLYEMILNDLATLSARGIELDVGGDGGLDPEVFVNAAARESFINDVRVRLQEQFEEFQTEFKQKNAA